MARATEPAGDAREDASDAPRASDARDEDEEEEETCGFCKYMKGGSCRAAFAAWEACVDAAKARDEDFVETCFETTSALRECMLRDPEYYGPMTGEEGERAEGARGGGGREGGRGGGGGEGARGVMGRAGRRRDF